MLTKYLSIYLKIYGENEGSKNKLLLRVTTLVWVHFELRLFTLYYCIYERFERMKYQSVIAIHAEHIGLVMPSAVQLSRIISNKQIRTVIIEHLVTVELTSISWNYKTDQFWTTDWQSTILLTFIIPAVIPKINKEVTNDSFEFIIWNAHTYLIYFKCYIRNTWFFTSCCSCPQPIP